MSKIKIIDATEVKSKTGKSILKVCVTLENDKFGVASCPFENNTVATQTQAESQPTTVDNTGNKETPLIKQAIENIKTAISEVLVGKEAEHQAIIDETIIALDGTEDKSRLGLNSIFAVSMAVAKAGASSTSLPLFMYLKQFIKNDRDPLKTPIPIFSLIKSTNSDDRSGGISEFLVVPASSKQYVECMRIGEITMKSLKQIIESKYLVSSQEDEGFTPDPTTNKDGFMLIQQAIAATQLNLGFDIFFGLNGRASKYFKDGKYTIRDTPDQLSTKDLIEHYMDLNQTFRLLYVEDPFDKNDWEGWTQIYEKLHNSAIIAGGDLIETNPYKLQMAVAKKAINAVVIKPLQIGTVIESLAFAEAAKSAGLKIIVSHRSTETDDDFLSDFAVAISADYVKIGSLTREENITKYNRLLQIDNQLKIL